MLGLNSGAIEQLSTEYGPVYPLEHTERDTQCVHVKRTIVSEKEVSTCS